MAQSIEEATVTVAEPDLASCDEDASAQKVIDS